MLGQVLAFVKNNERKCRWSNELPTKIFLLKFAQVFTSTFLWAKMLYLWP